MKTLNITAVWMLVLSAVFSIQTIGQAHANNDGWNDADAATFVYWAQKFSLPFTSVENVTVDRTVASLDELEEEVALSIPDPIHGINIIGTINLNSESSLVRILLVDSSSVEHLIYEVYPLLATEGTFDISIVCEESCFLEPTIAQSLKVEVVDASAHIAEISFLDQPALLAGEIPSARQEIKTFQDSVKINVLNARIQDKGLKWRAGETRVSRLSHNEKKRFFGFETVDRILNLQGFEYYVGGVFETLPRAAPPGVTNMVPDTFDWRNRHGANRPSSPYYDGDPLSSGWITPIRDQANCGSCWAFGATGATEAAVNLYFNDHIDLDLAEQDLLSCSGGGSCSGGWPDDALDYIKNTGIVDEACFPYSATGEICSNKCMVPAETIMIAGQTDFAAPQTEEKLKTLLIEQGPVSAGLWSLGHAMTLVGYDIDRTDGRTIWILKNSWGADWGERGYWRYKTNITDYGATTALLTPISSSVPRVISCQDNDGDGLYYWGISPDKPPACPTSAPSKNDCDDASPHLGALNSGRQCEVLDPSPGPLSSLVGDKDGIQAGDPVDVPPRSPRIEAILSFIENIGPIVGQGEGADLDENGFDRSVGFTHFFYLPEQAVVTSAILTIGVRGESALVRNDVILYDESTSLSEVDPACSVVPPDASCNPQNFFPLITFRDLLGREPQYGEALELEVDLRNAPLRLGGDPGPGGSWSTMPDERRNLLSTLADGELNVVVSDDVTVDYSELRVTYVLHSGVIGDFVGDGCVDRQDLNVIFEEIKGSQPRDLFFDLNGDQQVNIVDARRLVMLFDQPRGAPCP